jgi:hypothetical protein
LQPRRAEFYIYISSEEQLLVVGEKLQGSAADQMTSIDTVDAINSSPVITNAGAFA